VSSIVDWKSGEDSVKIEIAEKCNLIPLQIAYDRNEMQRFILIAISSDPEAELEILGAGQYP